MPSKSISLVSVFNNVSTKIHTFNWSVPITPHYFHFFCICRVDPVVRVCADGIRRVCPITVGGMETAFVMWV